MAKPRLKIVTPTTEKRTVTPTRRPNKELRSREHLTQTEVEKLIKATGSNREQPDQIVLPVLPSALATRLRWTREQFGQRLHGLVGLRVNLAGGFLVGVHLSSFSYLQAAVNLNAGIAFLRVAEAVAPSLGITVTAVNVHDSGEFERAVAEFASQPDGGLIVVPHPYTMANRAAIIILAARNRLPAIYPFRYFATGGGLVSYGPDQIDQWRGAAIYVSRILRGEEPGDLPVQAPTKYETVINLKTARTLGLTVPPSLLAIADEVIE